mmetsp:Transcript_121393/g.343521  ORF Transcript_121393/g.343521 Transcript_121393/m.343521 type:complete len:279 (-) Transcript_121393:331-1167(-)
MSTTARRYIATPIRINAQVMERRHDSSEAAMTRRSWNMLNTRKIRTVFTIRTPRRTRMNERLRFCKRTSKSATSTTPKSNTFQRQPGPTKNSRPPAPTRTRSSKLKATAKPTSTCQSHSMAAPLLKTCFMFQCRCKPIVATLHKIRHAMANSKYLFDTMRFKHCCNAPGGLPEPALRSMACQPAAAVSWPCNACCDDLRTSPKSLRASDAPIEWTVPVSWAELPAGDANGCKMVSGGPAFRSNFPRASFMTRCCVVEIKASTLRWCCCKMDRHSSCCC